MRERDHGFKTGIRIGLLSMALLAAAFVAFAASTVPTDVQQPGTQPGEAPPISSSCSCHYGTDNPEIEPGYGWEGGMMSNAMRDPLFWATVAIAEQDFLPNADPAQRGGVGDLCLRCHGPRGWLGEHSIPTDGSAFVGDEERGVECEFCHQLVDPDQPVNIPGTVEAQTAPFEAYDPDTGEGYYGSGQYVMEGNGTRLGPYSDAVANHAFLQSQFHRQGELCGTCHDVSNPAVGDLAHNFGAQVGLDDGYSGVPGGPVEQKAAFNHAPFEYGIVERTFSEWKAGALDTFRVDEYATLPADLRAPNGALDLAYHRAFDVVPPSANPNRPNYEDGTVRYFTCQTCHMAASTGKGCDKNQAPTRYDLPRHDQTGGGYWMPDVVLYQNDNGLLRVGSVDSDQRAAMLDGKSRAGAWLTAAASLSAAQVTDQLHVRVTNLTGHKLISGYPEGRRMWLNVKWYDGASEVIHEDGAYGPIGRTVADLSAIPHEVESLLDLDGTVVYEAEPGMDQEWASQLIGLGYDPNLTLSYDRLTDSVTATLGGLSATPAGSAKHTFHFVLNNVVLHDNRIPPYGFSYDEARERSCLPVPESQYGDPGPGPGNTYNHWDDQYFSIPPGAVTAEVTLYYQQTSWEYIQFLWLQNDGLGPFLGDEGVNMLDAWLNTEMSPPWEMAEATAAVEATCEPIAPDDVTCDGVDDDCDTQIDEDYTPTGTTCGVGVCEGNTGELLCQDGVEVDTCDPLDGASPDLCDGLDNDCNAATADGSDEAWLGQECDGPDSDLCTEGVYECSGGVQSCTDATSDDLDLCDGVDNDCNAATDDGSAEAWLGQECDGADSDLCTEGVYECSGGVQSCTDATSDDLDLCDGVDNDCNATTADGSDEAWLGQECDGPDSDLCAEGVYECSGGVQSCTDATSDNVDLCDGVDNDCNPATDDGSAEAWLGQECDGADSDLCTEGVYECSGGAQSCTDATSDDLDLCDGVDNDCNPATADGSDEAWLGQECDGPDLDLCTEGVYECSGGVQSCTDATSDDVDLCDGVDNDCNAATDDGSAEAWIGQECDGADSDLCTEGVYECSGGVQSCTDATSDDVDLCDGVDNDCNAATADGSDEAWLGQECDGPDSDLCTEGVYECSGGVQSCTDATSDNVDLCDGVDNDCNAATADGSDEVWSGQECDGADSDLCTEGIYECSGGVQSCTDATSDDLDLCDGVDNDCNAATADGSAEAWLGQECDGADSDLCTEGVYECSGGVQSCTDATSDDLDLCDGVDNDCNAATADGSAEAWLGQECDGADSDLCTEGVYECSGGVQSCTDATSDDLDLCDGVDNDCNAATDDGSAEAWLGQECDGEDSDLCTEGVYECSGGAQSCTDATSDDLDLCDGSDNDCNAATADGSDEVWSGQECDGADSDLCTEGVYECSGGVQSCTDATSDDLDLCDGVDNDCNAATADGSAEAWLGQECDGADSDLCTEGVYECSGGAQSCTDATSDDLDLCDGADNDCNAATADGSAEAWLGQECDGADSDLCTEGVYECSGGAQSCTDATSDDLDLCDGADNDCNAATADGLDEVWSGQECDGADSDLCTEGVYECSGGVQSCTDATSDDLDLCDGVDNDCNAATADGSAEAWLGQECDGADSDLCTEGFYECSGGAQSCTDATSDNLDLCDGADNDCNAATDDGSAEAWLGQECDGADSDLCTEGVYECSGGAQSCTDATSDDLDLCDGADNDCNAATDDGSAEAWLGQECDGADSDLCTEGVYECSGGAQSCTDATSDNLDLCDGVDNDCNAATDDGSDEAWLGQGCDGADSDLCTEGVYECSGGAQSCTDATSDDLDLCDGVDNDCNAATDDGSDEVWLGQECDGADSDLCAEGVYECNGGSQSCSDLSGDDVEVCDGADNDCDDAIDEDLPLHTYWQDSDGDQYGNPDVLLESCQETPPAGYVGQAGDCNDDDGSAWAIPGEVLGVVFGPGPETLSWAEPSPAGGISPGYDVLRSEVPDDFGAASMCLESDDGTDTTALDTEVPAPDVARFYLVRGGNSCGEGSLGQASDTSARHGRACP